MNDPSRTNPELSQEISTLQQEIQELEQSESDLKKVDERLSGALQHLSAHINNSPMAVIEFDPQFRIIRWSKEAERIFGWTLEEVKGRAISEMRWVYEADESWSGVSPQVFLTASGPALLT